MKTENERMQEYASTMSRPIPGQSLTDDPESPAPYLKAPEFTVVSEAIDYIFNTLIQEEKYADLVGSLDADATVLELTQVILFGGFNTGKWNPDLLLLLIEPTAYIIMALAEKAGVEYLMDDEDDVNDPDRMGALPKPTINPSKIPTEAKESIEKLKDIELPSLLQKVE
tara:strand:+ start:874 stop:1380 length:507 start_codon:yes stop_codon:yes gene_type:complete